MICVSIEDVLLRPEGANVKSLEKFVLQIKELLLSSYKNENLFQEFRDKALHLYCLFAFCDSIRNANTVTYNFLEEKSLLSNTVSEKSCTKFTLDSKLLKLGLFF
jgi:hypothetical protein